MQNAWSPRKGEQFGTEGVMIMTLPVNTKNKQKKR